MLSARRAGLPLGNISELAVRVVFVTRITFFVAISNHARGVSFAGLLVILMIGIGTFVARRDFRAPRVRGRQNAPGGAQGRDQHVPFIRICVFMISGRDGGDGRDHVRSRLQGVALSAGGGSTLLDAIAAAVIGGTSLFGGRGRVMGALLGGIVIQAIANGLELIRSNARPSTS